MEEENQVFGKTAEDVDTNENLESEDFNFYHQNKEEAKSNIDSSSKDLTDFIDSLIQDVPAPSEEEVNAGIEKILEKTHPTETQTETVKTNQKKKVTFKVLFIAALLSIVSFSCLYVVGSSHNISIENGFVSFAKETVQVVFFGEEKEEYISVDALLTDLKLHGYEDILFPQEFVTKSDEYKVSVPEYCSDEITQQVTFDILGNKNLYRFVIHNYNLLQQAFDYVDMDNARTVMINDICIYVFDYPNKNSAIEFVHHKYRYNISANIPYSEMVRVIETIK